MTDTLFIPKTTNIVATWTQAINDLAYKGRDPLYATTTGSANAYILTLPAGSQYSAYVAGDSFTFKANFTNTATATLQIVGGSTLTAVTLHQSGAAVAAGAIVAGLIYTVTYDGSNFQAGQAATATVVTYNEGDTGAVTTTVSAKLHERISVFDFMTAAQVADVQGLVGSLDITASFTAAINALQTRGGGELYCPAGIYNFPTAVTFTSLTNIQITGAGQAITVFKSTTPVGTPTAGAPVIALFTSCVNISIKDITFDVNSIVTTNANTSAVGFVGGSYITITYCSIVNGVREGLVMNGVLFFDVNHCTLVRITPITGAYQNEGFLATGANKKGNFSANKIFNWGTMFDGADLHIENNIVDTFGYGSGITINYNPSITVRPIIVGNTVSYGTGIDVNNTQPAGIECYADSATIVGNICYLNASVGIVYAGHWSLVSGNTCYNNGSYNATGAGITSNSGDGVHWPDYSVIIGNSCYDSGTNYQKYGYEQNSNSTEASVRVIGNYLAGYTGPYVFSSLATQINFEGYILENSASYTVGALATGSSTSVGGLTVSGAAMGDFVEVSCDAALLACVLTGYVSAANVVTIMLSNLTGASVTLGTQTFRARVHQRR